MWPSIPAYRGFSTITCPSLPTCRLPNCIFSHDTPPPQDIQTPVAKLAARDIEPDTKRVKLNDGTKEPVVSAPAVHVEPEPKTPSVFVGSIKPKDQTFGDEVGRDKLVATSSKTSTDTKTSDDLPKSMKRPVSPPPGKALISGPTGPSALVPRKVAKEPAPFARRLTFLKALHSYMKPQNDKLTKAVKQEIRDLHLDANQLNKLAMDEEAAIARDNPSVYENILKQRLVKLKGMTPEVWVKERREAVAKEKGEMPKRPQSRVETGLTPCQEISLLSQLICPQDDLHHYGYVTKLPTDEELNEAQLTQDSAGFWEVCERCNTRFQVFPERREDDGALTTGGACQHHWGRRVFTKRSRHSGPEPAKFSCCNEPMGSPGCVTHDSHVFKISDAKRLSLTMPFLETPENVSAPRHSAVCFDCEMGYTTHGLELMRLTVVSWPDHKPLVDVLVRPLGHLLDINTRFSGITVDQFLNAKPYDPKSPKPVRKDLRIVESPHAARDLFLSHVTTSTPVLGHALENDLNVIRLVHPTIVDTVLLYPTRQGLPYRHALRALAKMYLDEDVQQGGAAGHDSYEDSRTTGELVRFKVKEEWRYLKRRGWTVTYDGVFPPSPEMTPPLPAMPVPSMVPQAPMAALQGPPAEKRKIGGLDDEDAPPRKK